MRDLLLEGFPLTPILKLINRRVEASSLCQGGKGIVEHFHIRSQDVKSRIEIQLGIFTPLNHGRRRRFQKDGCQLMPQYVIEIHKDNLVVLYQRHGGQLEVCRDFPFRIPLPLQGRDNGISTERYISDVRMFIPRQIQRSMIHDYQIQLTRKDRRGDIGMNVDGPKDTAQKGSFVDGCEVVQEMDNGKSRRPIVTLRSNPPTPTPTPTTTKRRDPPIGIKGGRGNRRRETKT